MHRRIFILLGAASLLLGGCGSSSSGEDAGSTRAAAPPPAHVSVGTVAPKTPGAVESNPFGQAKPTWVRIEKTRPAMPSPQGAPPTDLVIEDLETGTGPIAEYGDEVTIMYSSLHFVSGKKFTSSWDWGAPTTFVLGEGLLDSGWETGVDGMQVGGRRELIVPGGFQGHSGFPPGYSPKDTLLYVVDLVAIDR
ncbi:MAG TPA: FKBP-type peptidyl-prolyl cis-trans isomerase [Solirubrobacterales bacterium]|nr:FKBP-type peptidyl-prolyl cis-trans isomerase [Solirubrobacterales bacterium]